MEESKLGQNNLEMVMNKTQLFISKNKERGKVISYESISLEEEAGIIRLYNELVPEAVSENIDVKMIYEQAFPAFEETIGKEAFSKVKQYFGIGIGIKKRAKNRPDKKIMLYLTQLRTIENATKYISGYKELIEKVAAKLVWAPEDMTSIEKAKLIRAYMIIFHENHFFTEDFAYSRYGENPVCKTVKPQLVAANNKKELYPEELFFLYDMIIRNCTGMMYEMLLQELLNLDKRLRKEIFSFAELELVEDGKVKSVNNPAKSYTFASVRKMKVQANPIRSYYPAYLFAEVSLIKEWDFGMLYKIYRILEVADLKELPVAKFPSMEIEAGQVVTRERNLYRFNNEQEGFSSVQEAERFKRYFRCLVEHEYILNVAYILEDAEIETRKVNIATFMGAVNFARKAEYLSIESKIDREFEVAEHLIARAEEDSSIWIQYQKGEINFEEVRLILAIDENFEREVLHFKKKETSEEAAKRFALETCHKEYDVELFNNVIFAGNEKLFQKYAEQEIGIRMLKNQLGYDEDFADMYFSLRAVDISAIEQRLLEIKRSFSGKNAIKNNKLLISLYCYLVEGQIACGSKNKVPKRNKALKPKNLRELLKN